MRLPVAVGTDVHSPLPQGNTKSPTGPPGKQPGHSTPVPHSDSDSGIRNQGKYEDQGPGSGTTTPEPTSDGDARDQAPSRKSEGKSRCFGYTAVHINLYC